MNVWNVCVAQRFFSMWGILLYISTIPFIVKQFPIIPCVSIWEYYSHTYPGVPSLQPHVYLEFLSEIQHTNITVVVLQPRLPALRLAKLALSLLVLWILTDYSDASFSLNDFAFFANWFNWWSNLHSKILLSKKVRVL